MDAKNSIDFCDPLNPQFIPVVAMRSPVLMTLDAPPARAGEPWRARLTLRTASGKPIAPEDLLVVHTRLLHLLIVDPTLTDYQHVHPQPTRTPGEWGFSFTPRHAGTYRIFADFTPVATGRGLYANADLEVAAAADGAATPGRAARPGPEAGGAPLAVERDGYRFSLVAGTGPIRARQPADLKFVVTRADGGRVPMAPIMGAFAHLVAFDATRSGFAHLHPMEVDLAKAPDAVRPELNFKITIPRAGRYAIWAQLDLGGRETFVPFWFDVVE